MQDTYRGRVCQCPLVDGVQFEGDGYTTCEGNLPLFLYVLYIMRADSKINEPLSLSIGVMFSV